jgi:nicotinamidase-related amidase
VSLPVMFRTARQPSPTPLTRCWEDMCSKASAPLTTVAYTYLEFTLRSKGIPTVALDGFLTNCCVESTMRSAYGRGYDVVTLTD